MSNLLLTNIHQLINVRKHPVLLRGQALQELPVLNNAWVQIINGRIADYGTMDICPDAVEVWDLKGASVLPCWCDSHTHVVFAASREDEFVDKLKGLSYAEIAAKGGGILNSASKLSLTTEEVLYEQAKKEFLNGCL